MQTWRRTKRRTKQQRTRRKIRNDESCYENDENLRK
jgi:hypothetical protein